MTECSALSGRLGRSAESIGLRGGRLVPLRYGSAAGELALCVRAVGLVDREDLRVLSVTTHPNGLDRLTAAILNGRLAIGEAATAERSHWGRLAPDRALVVLPSVAVPALCERLLRQPWALEASVEETALQAIGVIGPETAGLLADLGADGAAFATNGRGRIATSSVAGAVAWMLLDDSSALALVEPEDAVGAWTAISAAGRRFGLGYVGAEAAERFDAIRCPTGDRVGH
ncbi:MAG: hypothetical protein JST08_20660 [Actinobacteria bacterium]|nr:hypothetical protein [Actinomycetota bacterium]